MKSISSTLASTMRCSKLPPSMTRHDDAEALLGSDTDSFPPTNNTQLPSPSDYDYDGDSEDDEDDSDLILTPPPRGITFYSRFTLLLLYNTINFLKPSFIGTATTTTTTSPLPSANDFPSRTAYLDGIRGIASLIVVNLHWSRTPYPSVQTAWGANENYNPLLLPFLRLIHCGAAMVAIFFVISGFVLAHRSLELIHRREYERMYSGLTSSAFRRWLRLFLPALAASVITYMFASCGWIRFPKHDQDGNDFVHGLNGLVRYWGFETNVWQWELLQSGFYNPQLWTISIQYKGSLICYLLLLALARCGIVVRLVGEGMVMVHAAVYMRWDMALFVGGMILAEVDVLLVKRVEARERRLFEAMGRELEDRSGDQGLLGEQDEEDEDMEKEVSQLRPWQHRQWRLGPRVKVMAFNTVSWAVLIVGLYLAGYPREQAEESPFYAWAQHTWPYSRYRRRFWIGVGALMTCAGIMVLKPIQRIFTTSFALYMGKISFALYLVHYAFVQSLGKALEGWMRGLIGKQELWQHNTTFVVATLILYPTIIWAADVFVRTVEVPSTRFARWFENKCRAKAQ